MAPNSLDKAPYLTKIKKTKNTHTCKHTFISYMHTYVCAYIRSYIHMYIQCRHSISALNAWATQA